MRAVVLFDYLGPYHFARLKALATRCEVIALEVATRSAVYDWRRVDSEACFERATLFDVPDSSTLRFGQITEVVTRALERYAPDVVFVPGWATKAALAALGWCLQRGVSAVVMSESTLHDKMRRRSSEFVKGRIVANFGAALVGGEPQRAYLGALGMSPDRIFLGYNAIDNQYFEQGAVKTRSEAAEMRRRLGLPDRYFLASSRFVPQKNLEGLLDAFIEFRRLRPESRTALVLLGDGPSRVQLEARRTAIGLDAEIIMPGFKQYNELPGYYALADAFVHISRIEPWGLVVNEAMASGLPVVVSEECGCAVDLVRDGYNGAVVPFNDTALIAGTLARLDDQPALRGAMGLRSAEIIVQWSPRRFAEGAAAAAEAAVSHVSAWRGLVVRSALNLRALVA